MDEKFDKKYRVVDKDGDYIERTFSIQNQRKKVLLPEFVDSSSLEKGTYREEVGVTRKLFVGVCLSGYCRKQFSLQ